MSSQLILLGVAALAVAAPTAHSVRQIVPNYPQTSSSQGFTLVANVTDQALDTTPSLQNLVLAGAHTGAGLSDGILSLPDSARVFYVNGTVEEQQFANTKVLTDAGTPPFPMTLSLMGPDADGLRRVSIGVSGDSVRAGLSRFPEPYAFLVDFESSGKFVACTREIPYYHQDFTVVGHVADGTPIPAGCVPINLLPQCATLAGLPAGSLASHEFAATSRCYPNVASLAPWSQYGP